MEWLITKSGLKNIRCIAGAKGLNARMDGVSIVDSPGAIKWAKPDELVMTTGYFLTDNPQGQKRMIRELKKAGCTGLAMKVNSYFDEIPEEMIYVAEQEGLPLLEIPYYYSFSEISQTIYNHIFEMNYQTRIKEQRLIEDISDIFFSKRGVMEIVYRIAEYLKRTVILTDSDFQCVYAAKKMSDKEICMKDDSIRKAGIMEGDHGEFVFSDKTRRPAYCVLIPDADSYLLILEDKQKVSKDEECLIERCTKILSMGLEQVRNRKDNLYDMEDVRYQKLYDHLSGLRQFTGQELKELLQELEFPVEKRRIVLLVWLSQVPETGVDIKEILRSGISNSSEFRGLDSCVFFRKDKYVIYLFARGQKTGPFMEYAAGHLADEMLEKLHNLTGEIKIRIGISKSSQEIAGIREGYQEAEKAMELGEQMGLPEEKFAFGKLGIYDYLLQYPRMEKDQMSEHIHYLLKYDAENNTELTQTLLKFLECKFNISETAKELYIHRNTLINRMNKIKELLYDDLESMDTLIPLCVESYAYRLFS